MVRSTASARRRREGGACRGRTDEAERVDEPVEAAEHEVEHTKNDDESRQEFDVLAVRVPDVARKKSKGRRWVSG
jgi:hypothetical protein